VALERRDHPLGFQVDVLLRAGLVRARDHDRGPRERTLDIALHDLQAFEHVVRAVLDLRGPGRGAEVEGGRLGGDDDFDRAGGAAGKGNRRGVAAARFLSQFAAGFALPPCEASAMRSTSALLSLAVVGLSACAAAARVGAPAPAPAPALPAALDSTAIRPGRFDAGKMWTFDTPPLDYFQEAHGFRPDSTWLARARLGALRFADYCS